MTNIFMYVLIIIMSALGVVSSIAVLGAIPIVLIQKIYGKIRYGRKLTD